MVVSILRRKTAIADAAEWEKRASRYLERVRPLLDHQAGFAGIDLRRGAVGELTEETRWHSIDDCRRYVREGGAALVATIADAILPTAPYPNGAWMRETSEE